MIGVSVKQPPALPTPPPCRNSICTEPKSEPINLTFIQNIGKIQTSSQNEANQCNDGNRPPNSPPINGVNNRPFNYNRTFQMAEAEYASWVSQFTQPIAEANVFWTMYQRHKNDGIYDIKSNRSPYQGNDDDGNFLYGGLMASFGFSLSETQRYSAAYQAIQDSGVAGFPLSIYNFISNTGDNLSDDQMVSRGWRYKKEVHNNNRSDINKPTSCTPLNETSDNNDNGTGGSGGSGGGGKGGNPGTGDGSWPGFPGGGGGGGSWVCFVQEGHPTYCFQE